MKRIFKNKFIACIIAAVVALSAAVFACFYLNKNDTVEAQAATVTDTYYQISGTTLYLGGTSFSGSTKLNLISGYQVDNLPWYSLTDSKITTVTFVSALSPNDVAYWFANMHKLTTINNLSLLDVSNVARLQSLFFNCDLLTSLDLSTFNAPSGLGGINYIGGTTVAALKQITLSASLIQYVGVGSDVIAITKKNWYRKGDDNVYGDNGIAITEADTYYDTPQHVHSFGDWTVTTPATCVATGLNERVCSVADCFLANSKEKEVIPIDPNAHNFDTTTWKSDASNHWYECTLCQAVQPNSSVGHTAGAAATCTTDQTCTVCNRVLTPQLGHAWDTSWQSDASGHWHECTHAGCNEKDSENTHNPDRAAADCVNGVTCTTCNYNIATAIGHNYSNDVTPPDCENGGYTTHTCANCGDSYVDSQVSANGHRWGAPIWQWAANYLTCKAKFTCSSCNKEQLETASVTHNTATASCTQAGDTTHTASVTFNNTGYSDEKVINGQTLPHSGSLVSTTIAPTCTEDGVGEYKCLTCDKTYTDIIPSHGGHDLVSHGAQAPNCTEAGWDAYDTCSRCDYTTKTEIPPLGHDWASVWSKDETNHWHICTRGCDEINDEAAHAYTIWKVDTAATLTSTGVGHYECVCGARGADEVIPMETCSHTNKTHIPAVEATCMAAGNPEYWTCGDCGKNLDGTNTEISTIVTPVDPNNHSYTDYVSNNDADCTTDGTKTAHCDYACGTDDTITDVGSATGHDWATTWSKDETNHWHECSRCDEINDEAAHTHEWVITTPATTEADGLMENLCTECGHKDGEEVIAKLDDGNGNEIDLPVDIDVEFNVTQSNTGNYYSDIDKGLKRGYWAQLWYRNGDGTLGDEFTDKINCFLTLKIPDEIVKGILDGEPISRDKIAEGLSVYYINENGTPVEVENFTIVLREDNSCQIKFNYNEKFRAEIVFAADVEEDEESGSGIPWWVWLIVGLVAVAIVGVVIIIIVVIKKKNNGDGGTTVVQGTQYDDAELKAQLAKQDEKIDRLIEITDGGFNDFVDEE